MKLVIFRGINRQGKTIRGSFHCSERPNRAQTIAERLAGSKLTHFIFTVKDIKITMEKCEVEE